VTKPVLDSVALVLPTTKRQVRVVDRGGRHLFLIPWRNASLIGTSNVPFDGSPSEVRATEKDVVDFLADVNRALPGVDLSARHVRQAFAGLYPLTADEILPDVYQATGTYQVCDHDRVGKVSRLVSVLTTKYTTARKAAELAVDLVLEKLGQPARPSQTCATPLAGGAIDHLPTYLSDAERRYRSRLDNDVIRYLVGHYGTEIDAVMSATAEGVRSDARLSAERESIEAEVLFAVTSETAQHLDDVVFRRTGLGTIGHPGAKCLARCAEIMARELEWSSQRTEEELRRTEALLSTAALSNEGAYPTGAG
jgi:glycerol-3-phosphate dehydrogenase